MRPKARNNFKGHSTMDTTLVQRLEILDSMRFWRDVRQLSIARLGTRCLVALSAFSPPLSTTHAHPQSSQRLYRLHRARYPPQAPAPLHRHTTRLGKPLRSNATLVDVHNASPTSSTVPSSSLHGHRQVVGSTSGLRSHVVFPGGYFRST